MFITTQAEMDALLAQGWVVAGGPFATFDECNVNCGGSSSSSSSTGKVNICCFNVWPNRLYLSFDGANINCFPVWNTLIPLDYNAATNHWEGFVVGNGNILNIRFYCVAVMTAVLEMNCNGGSWFGCTDSPALICHPVLYTCNFDINSVNNCICPGGLETQGVTVTQ